MASTGTSACFPYDFSDSSPSPGLLPQILFCPLRILSGLQGQQIHAPDHGPKEPPCQMVLRQQQLIVPRDVGYGELFRVYEGLAKLLAKDSEEVP
jgi:hypothetical protein